MTPVYRVHLRHRNDRFYFFFFLSSLQRDRRMVFACGFAGRKWILRWLWNGMMSSSEYSWCGWCGIINLFSICLWNDLWWKKIWQGWKEDIRWFLHWGKCRKREKVDIWYCSFSNLFRINFDWTMLIKKNHASYQN